VIDWKNRIGCFINNASSLKKDKVLFWILIVCFSAILTYVSITRHEYNFTVGTFKNGLVDSEYHLTKEGTEKFVLRISKYFKSHENSIYVVRSRIEILRTWEAANGKYTIQQYWWNHGLVKDQYSNISESEMIESIELFYSFGRISSSSWIKTDMKNVCVSDWKE
jgi:hypothetical protein